MLEKLANLAILLLQLMGVREHFSLFKNIYHIFEHVAHKKVHFINSLRH